MSYETGIFSSSCGIRFISHFPLDNRLRENRLVCLMEDRNIREEEVSWQVMGIDIFGTIVAPDDDNAHPGIVMVAGSGPTDRDWCSPILPGKNGSGRLLAEALAREGYVSLRYDKMASGPNVMENLPKFSGKLSMETHLDEVAGAALALNSCRNVARNQIFALTSSEGAIHAVNYQLGEKHPKFRGLIMTGAPGRSVGEVARSQLSEQGKNIPGADLILAKYDEAVEQFLHGIPMEFDNGIPEGVKILLRAMESPHNLPFSRELWAYSISEHASSIQVPVLVLIGKKDIQVSWKEDGKVLEEALSQNRDATFSYPENANHVLKHEEMPLENLSADYVSSHYNSGGAQIDQGAMKSIISWLKMHT